MCKGFGDIICCYFPPSSCACFDLQILCIYIMPLLNFLGGAVGSACLTDKGQNLQKCAFFSCLLVKSILILYERCTFPIKGFVGPSLYNFSPSNEIKWNLQIIHTNHACKHHHSDWQEACSSYIKTKAYTRENIELNKQIPITHCMQHNSHLGTYTCLKHKFLYKKSSKSQSLIDVPAPL